jgi:hypothetical protein
MAEDELWLTRDQALAKLQRVLKLSAGAAEAAFEQAISSGTVRTRSLHVILIEPGMTREAWYERLDPQAWQGGDHRSVNGEVSSDDLEFWVAQKLAIHSPAPPADVPKKHLRYALDDKLAAEGVAGILSSPPKWANANQAAITLAGDAVGTDKAKVDRLGRKISKLLETSRNTPKD